MTNSVVDATGFPARAGVGGTSRGWFVGFERVWSAQMKKQNLANLSTRDLVDRDR
jgi:hypothetical protein